MIFYRVPDLTTPAAGHSMSSEDFADAVLKQLNQDNTQDILVFIQDQVQAVCVCVCVCVHICV